MRRVVTFALASTMNPLAHAGTRVQQTVTMQVDQQKITEKHEWLLDAEQFRLQVSQPGREIHYIFNGQTFQACIRAPDAAHFTQPDGKKANAKILDALKSGVCVPAPINVVTSFYLSPHNFVSALDITDSLQLRLKLKELSHVDGAKQTILGRECIKRESKMQYEYFAYLSGHDLQNQAIEAGCVAADLTWRRGLWRQLSRMLLQQKSGRELRQSLMEKKLEDEGLSLTKEASFQIQDTGKKQRQVELSVATDKIEPSKFVSKDFAAPHGYQIQTHFTDVKVASTKSGTSAVATTPTENIPSASTTEEKDSSGKLDLNMLLWFMTLAL